MTETVDTPSRSWFSWAVAPAAWVAPFAGAAVVLFPPDGFVVRWLVGLPLSWIVVGMVSRLPKPWGNLTYPVTLWFAILLVSWAPDVVWEPFGFVNLDAWVAAGVLGSMVWWWRVVWVTCRVDRPVVDPHPDVAAPRQIRVGPDPGVSPWSGSGLEVGHESAEPLPARTVSVAQPVMVDVTVPDDDPAPAGDPVAVLAAAVANAWGDSPVMHMDELAAALDADKQVLMDELREAGAPIDPKARKRRNGQSVPKAGMRRDDFDVWRTTLSTS